MAQYLYGKNSVLNAIEAKKVIEVFLKENFKDENVFKILKENKIFYSFKRKEEIDFLSNNQKNQGIIAKINDYKSINLDELIDKNKGNESSILIVLDNLEDPHNLGAILRIADAFNVDGIIYKKNNQVGLTPTVAKVSTGAINFVDCVEVTNLSQTISKLKEYGYWVYASDMNAKHNYFDIKYPSKTVLIIGSEGFGISRLVKENSDELIKIPMSGHVDSLNASNACAIIVSEVYRQLKLKN